MAPMPKAPASSSTIPRAISTRLLVGMGPAPVDGVDAADTPPVGLGPELAPETPPVGVGLGLGVEAGTPL